MHLSRDIVDGLAVAEGLVDRGLNPYMSRSLNSYGHSKKYLRSLKLSVTSGISCRALGSSRAMSEGSGGSAVSKY